MRHGDSLVEDIHGLGVLWLPFWSNSRSCNGSNVVLVLRGGQRKIMMLADVKDGYMQASKAAKEKSK